MRPARTVQSTVAVRAKHFTELLVWQLANDLRQFVYAITESGSVSRNFEFRSQMREAADSVCENTAEGFGRYGHPEFARFLTIAKASLDEVESKLRGGTQLGYFTKEQYENGLTWIKRTNGAMIRLLRYLRTSDAPEPFSSP